MKQSESSIHTAIIMDGNNRWAAVRGLHCSMGDRAGARAIRRVIEAAPGLGIRILTLYAFSSDNRNQPPEAFSEAIADVDLLIRTGGEPRSSDFLLPENANAEVVLSPKLWPDFDAGDLQSAVDAFRNRRRTSWPAPAAMGQSKFGDEAGAVCHLRRDRWLR